MTTEDIVKGRMEQGENMVNEEKYLNIVKKAEQPCPTIRCARWHGMASADRDLRVQQFAAPKAKAPADMAGRLCRRP